MTRTDLVNFTTRTIKEFEQRLLEMQESVRQAAETVPTALQVLVVLGSIFLAFAQLIRPR